MSLNAAFFPTHLLNLPVFSRISAILLKLAYLRLFILFKRLLFIFYMT